MRVGSSGLIVLSAALMLAAGLSAPTVAGPRICSPASRPPSPPWPMSTWPHSSRRFRSPQRSTACPTWPTIASETTPWPRRARGRFEEDQWRARLSQVDPTRPRRTRRGHVRDAQRAARRPPISNASAAPSCGRSISNPASRSLFRSSRSSSLWAPPRCGRPPSPGGAACRSSSTRKLRRCVRD